MMKRRFLTLWICFSAGVLDVNARPQFPLDSLSADKSGRWALRFERALWLRSDNSAGVGLDTMLSVATASVSGQTESGSFHRPQQASAVHAAGLEAERIQAIRKLSFYGGFRFRQKWEEDIRWADILDPYRGTPYVLADSLGGDWKKQLFNLSATLATNPLFSRRVSLGLAVEYEVETGARQNDPRPLNYAKNLRLSPGVIWSPAPGTRTGLSFSTGFFREEVEMENRQPTAHRQYRLKGLSIHDAPTIFSLSVTRAYTGNDLAAGWQFEKQFRNSIFMSSLGFGHYIEDTRDGITRPTLGGQFKSRQWNWSGVWRRDHTSGYGELSFHVLQKKGDGREYHQVYDPAGALWVTAFEGIFYKTEFTNAGLGYTITGYTADRQSVDWKLSASGCFSDMSSRYLYNQLSSQQISSAEAEVRAEKLVAGRRRQTVRIFLSGLYRANISEELVYPSRGTNARAANELLYPDHAWLSADMVGGGASLRYSFFPATYTGTQFYLSGSGTFTRGIPSSETYYQSALRTSLRVALGIFY